jgi:Fic family protein
MSFKDLLATIDENQQKIAAFGIFDDEILKKINYKLRLDWNYYSNRMEGGTLTKAETRSVMIGNIDVKGKPFKDVAEMTGHDKIILEVLKMSRGELRIAEKRIKEIHKAIMYEEDPEKFAQIGQWKKDPNEIIGYKNEKISFTQPGDVAEEVHKLLDKMNAELDKIFAGKEALHPVALAAQFHIDYVSIHPFYDGNGRTSRILTNILLMSCGYPTIVIKDEHKQAYYKLLGDIQAYGGKADLFYSFIAERVIDTQQLVLDALEGKDIEEKDDIDKEILLFKRELDANEQVGTIKKSNEVIVKLYKDHLKYFFDQLIEKHQQLDELFAENSFQRMINNAYSSHFGHYEDYILHEFSNSNALENRYPNGIESFGLGLHHKGFRKDGLNLFDFHKTIYIKFDDFTYQIGHQNAPKATLLYANNPSKEELSKIVSELMKEHLEEIKKKIGPNGKK